MHLIAELSDKIKAWGARKENVNVFILGFACVVGCLAGFGAFLLKRAIHFVSLFAHWIINKAPLEWEHAEWWLLVFPLVGILIAVVWQKWIAKANMVDSTGHIKDYLASRNYDIPAGMMYNPIAACGITLGFGGSAGAEGPIAYAGAAVGSKLGRVFGLDDNMLRVMIGIGAGAGIAGIFKSPIAGVLFTLEVLRMNMAAIPVTALILSSVCASVTCYAFTGTHLYLPYNLGESETLPIYWVALLGLFCGLYSLLYNWVTATMQKFFKSRKHQWVSWLTGGAIAGIILLMFPSMYGEGYPEMTKLINGVHHDILAGGPLDVSSADTVRFIAVLTLLLVLKALATVCSNSAGGVAGSFAPTLFAGAVAGTLFALLVRQWLGIDLPAPLCAMIAMGGAFAGIVKAPVMSIFLISEMTGATEYILPICICSIVSFALVRSVGAVSKKAAKPQS
ncbi:MAG: chloride channel protein [Muribaculaceae bacterium]|nr:chloride channel protein [Muribaculaceae bacterium]